MIRFHIANMNCGGCAKGVAAALREADPHAEPRFDLDRREVALDAPATATERLSAALLRDGWEAKLLPA
ncbi:copper chaperone [Roseomonas sp. KE2513]|uniref:heavy-metal-associated domain-containing protein n=1 Tax=Roseomonas sp. KE2513 TaxID=2479202 RepID=UPI0018DEF66B|nr:heavy-metal-associated domain-containing protein [Roseomonas sp. KE2513]MBI0535069.1 copper chaperone [Roseomonas sp. KE2513]